ncbi:ArsR family transcriptional regulator [Nitrososphaera sp. AFS]|jgi:predicted transcriptional regulator|nr:ArsR family transcriptional regulator [Nitrososphaera sp. AFS]
MIIKSQRIKKALLIALADEDMIKVMDSIMDRSKSFNDIVAENSNISRTTAFRKIKWLLNEGLIIVDKIILTPDGKKFSLYHSTLKAINAKYEANNVSVEAEPNFDIAKKWIEKFFSLD